MSTKLFLTGVAVFAVLGGGFGWFVVHAARADAGAQRVELTADSGTMAWALRASRGSDAFLVAHHRQLACAVSICKPVPRQLVLALERVGRAVVERRIADHDLVAAALLIAGTIRDHVPELSVLARELERIAVIHAAEANSQPEPGSSARADSRRLTWALDAQHGSLEDLVRGNVDYLIAAAEWPRFRSRLTKGIERLALAVIEDDVAVRNQRRTLAIKLAQIIESLPEFATYRNLTTTLRRIPS